MSKILAGNVRKGGGAKPTTTTTKAPKATQNTTTTSVKEDEDEKKKQSSTKTSADLASIKSGAKQVNKTLSAKPITETKAEPAKTLTSPQQNRVDRFDNKNKTSANTEIPTLSADDQIIKEYESIPEYNLFQRSFGKNANANNDAYFKKQGLYSDYLDAKTRQVDSLLNSVGLTASDVTRQSGNTRAENKRISQMLKDKGLSDKQIDDVKLYASEALANKADTNLTRYADENPFLGSVLSVPLNTAAGIGDSAGNISNFLSGKPISSNNLTKSVENMRGAVSEDMGKVGNFLYGTGMSVGDMAFNMLTGGNIASALMGAEKAASTMNDATDRGLTPGQILAEGGVSGLTTAITERIPMGKWAEVAEKGLASYAWKDIAKYVLSSMGAEGLQEGAENVADMLADVLIAGDKSQIKTSIEDYKASGLSEKDAKAQAWKDYGVGVITDILGGALAGGVMAGGSAAIGRATNGNNNADIPTLNEDVNTDTTEELPNVSEDEILADLAQNEIETYADEESDLYGGELTEDEINALTEGLNINPTTSVNDINSQIADLQNQKAELQQRYDETVARSKEGIDASQFGGNTELASMFNNNYTEEGLALKKEAEAIQREMRNIDSQIRELASERNGNLENELQNMRDSNGQQFEEYSGNENNDFEEASLTENELGDVDNAEFTDEELNALLGNIPQTETVNNDVRNYEDLLQLNGLLDAEESQNTLVPAQESNVPTVTGEVENNGEETTDWDNRNRRAVYDENGDMAVTQYANNTLYSLPTVRNNPDVQAYMKAEEAEGTMSAETMSNEESVKRAKQMLEAAEKVGRDIDGVIDDLTSSNSGIDEFGAVQQDMLQIALDQKLSEAQASGDYTGVREIIRKVVQKEHKIGQALQALAKYSHTASSAVLKAETLIKGKVEKGLSNKVKKATRRIADDIVNNTKQNTQNNNPESNPERAGKENQKLARVLKEIENGKQKRNSNPKTFEQIREEVVNTLQNRANDFYDDLSDGEIDFITQMVSDGTVNYNTLADEIEYRMKNDSFYSIDESTPIRQRRSPEINSALREASENLNKEAPRERTLNEIKAEVRARIEAEPASISDSFTDEDIDYLANRIFNGADSKEIADLMNTKLAIDSFGISNEDLAQVVELYNAANSGTLSSKEEYQFTEQANAILAKYLGQGTVMERLNQWRYLAMLSSPSTHLKNMLSNTAWGIVTTVKDTLGATAEAIAKASGADFERTKAVILPTRNDANLLRSSWQDFNDWAYSEYARGGSKYNDRNEIKQQQQIGSKAVNTVSDAVSTALEKEDIVAGRMKYTQALTGYLKANKANPDIFTSTDANDMALLERARQYALNEAMDATFHSDNKTANTLSRLSRSTSEGGMWGINMVLEGLMPFKKTTANITRQFMVEYNPIIQLPKAVIQAVSNNGDVPGTINSLAKGMTGTGLIALGWALANAGILVGKNDDDKSDLLDENQDYALIWYDDDGIEHSYTIDGLAPTAMLLCAGAEFAKSKLSKDFLTGMSESFIENSLLSGVNGMIEDIAYSNYDKEKHKAVTLGANLANNYISQYVPTPVSKLARTIDPTRRSTYTGKKGDADTIAKYGKKMLNKIPGLSYLNEPYINAYGEEEQNVGKNALTRGLYNFTSIGYYSERERDEVQKKIAGLDEYAQTLEGSARDEMEKAITDLLASPDKSFEGERIPTNKYTEFSKNVGKNGIDNFTKLVSSESFNNLEPKAQAKVMNDIDNFTRKIASIEVLGDKPKGEYEKLYEQWQNGDIDSIIDHYCQKEAFKLYDIDSSDYTKDYFEENGYEGLPSLGEKVSEAKSIAESYNRDDIRDSELQIYINDGEDALKRQYEYEDKMDELELPHNTVTKKLYEGNQADLNRYKQALDIAKQYGADSITETQWKTYRSFGRTEFEKLVNSQTKLDEFELPDNEFTREYVNKYGEAGIPKLEEAWDVIQQIENGQDKYGDTKYLNISEKTMEVLNDKGKKGLETYATVLGSGDKNNDGSIGYPDRILQLESMGGTANEKGYYFSKIMSGEASKGAKQAQKDKGYAGLYTWYLYKNSAASTKKSDIKAYIDKQNISDSEKEYWKSLY